MSLASCVIRGNLYLMKKDLCFPDKSCIAHEILAYLVDNPDARDTLDGIIHWWMLDRKIRYQMKLVEQVLDELIKKKLVLCEKKTGSKDYYRLNSHKIGEIEDLLQRK